MVDQKAGGQAVDWDPNSLGLLSGKGHLVVWTERENWMQQMDPWKRSSSIVAPWRG